MYFGKKKGIACILLAGCLLFTTEFHVMAANPQSEAQTVGTVSYEIEVPAFAEIWNEIPELADKAMETKEWRGKALANTNDKADVYAAADGAVIGKMYTNTIVTVEEKGDVWSKISSGSVVGYVKNESLLFGTAAVEKAKTACANGTRDAKTLAEIATEQKQTQV